MNKMIIAAITLALVSTTAAAEAPTSNLMSGFGVSAKAGTAGLGIDLTKAINDNFKVRAGYSSYEYDTTHTEENVDYDATLRLGGVSLLADYHPWAGGFRVTAGGYTPKHRLNGTAKYIGSTSTVTINGTTYSSNDLANLTLDAKWNGFRPYLGLGYDGFNKTKAGLFFTADVGVIFSGSPTVSLTANCVNAALCAQATADLTAETAKLRGDIDGAKYLPVVQFGIGYRF
jgi:outer membrane protein W